jgi:hypothetical protein
MNEIGDVNDLWLSQRDRRHAIRRTTVPHDVAEELAPLIAEDQLRSQKVGPATIAAACICAVTERAMDAVKCLSTFKDRGVDGGTGRILSVDESGGAQEKREDC